MVRRGRGGEDIQTGGGCRLIFQPIQKTLSPFPPTPYPTFFLFSGLIDAVVSRPGVPVAVPVDRARAMRVGADVIGDVGRAQIAGKRVIGRVLDDRGEEAGGVQLETVYTTKTMKAEGVELARIAEAAAQNDGLSAEAAVRVGDLVKAAYLISGSEAAGVAAGRAALPLLKADARSKQANVAAMTAMNAEIERRGGKPVPLSALFLTKEQMEKRKALRAVETEALRAAAAAAKAEQGGGEEGGEVEKKEE